VRETLADALLGDGEKGELKTKAVSFLVRSTINIASPTGLGVKEQANYIFVIPDSK
jgi:hypothetical protein